MDIPGTPAYGNITSRHNTIQMQPIASEIQVATEAETLQFFQRCYSNRQSKIWSYYSSDFDRIITDERYMLIPIDERMATRAHAVFDVVYLKRLRLINLEQHISRLLRSAKELCIDCPISQQRIQQVVKSVCRVALEGARRVGHIKAEDAVFPVRMVISSGYGDFGIASLGKKPTFYAAVSEPFINYELEKAGVKEYVVKVVEGHQEHSNRPKTVSYAENALMANQSKRQGGYQGIKMTKEGILLEAAVANIAFVFSDGEFATPRFQTVVKGTTLVKCLTRVEQLIAQKKLSRLCFRDISLEQAYTASEMMVLGGDKIVPVLSLDNHQLCQQKGPIVTQLQDWYEATLEDGPSIYE